MPHTRWAGVAAELPIGCRTPAAASAASGGVQGDGLPVVGGTNEPADVVAADGGDGPAEGVDAGDKPTGGTVEEVGDADGGGNVGTTIPGGGAATASGSSISSTGRSGKAS